MNLPPAPLPTGWCAFTDEATSRTYYAHIPTGNVQWDPPPSNPPPPPPIPPAAAIYPPPPAWAVPQGSSSGAVYNSSLVTPSSTQFPLHLPPYPINNTGIYQSSPHLLADSHKLPPAPFLIPNSTFQPRGLKRPPIIHEPHPNKRVHIDPSSNNNVKDARTRTCAFCKKVLGWDDFAKRQWNRNDKVRKCKHCVKTVEEEETNDAPKQKEERKGSDSNTSATLEESLSRAEEVSPVSPLTNTQSCKMNKVGVKYSHTQSTRNCSKCKKDCEWNQFSKTQWTTTATARRCNLCLEGDRIARLKAKDEGAQTLLGLSVKASVNNVESEHVDPQQHEPEQVSSEPDHYHQLEQDSLSRIVPKATTSEVKDISKLTSG